MQSYGNLLLLLQLLKGIAMDRGASQRFTLLGRASARQSVLEISKCIGSTKRRMRKSGGRCHLKPAMRLNLISHSQVLPWTKSQAQKMGQAARR